VKSLSNGEYFHFGLKRGIQLAVGNGGLQEGTGSLSIKTNFDGLPVFKSGQVPLSFWPILCILCEAKIQGPFPVGIFCGCNKPDPINSFLEDFISELIELNDNGIEIEGRWYRFSLSGPFICDAPARAYLKSIVKHNSYYGCERCVQSGSFERCVVFPRVDSLLRTDDSFRSCEHKEHHMGISPLSTLPIGMVSQFPLDYMHLACLGVLRKMLFRWLEDRTFRTRLSGREIERLSGRFVEMESCIPREFSRKAGALKFVKSWKATQFRQVLLYSGPVAFRGLLREDVYGNFMLFHGAMAILLSPRHCQELLELARFLLKSFVSHCIDLYGRDMVVYNVHSLIHLPDDVLLYGNLNNISCFPFESFLHQMKCLVHSSSLPLQQVCKRILEKQLADSISSSSETNDSTISLKQPHDLGPTEGLRGQQFKQLLTHSFLGSISHPDNCLLLKSQSVILVDNFIRSFSSLFILGRRFLDVRDFYSYPFKSSMLSIFLVGNLSAKREVFSINDISAKCILLPCKDDLLHSYAAFPLLHQILK
jgi:hypothetical protein